METHKTLVYVHHGHTRLTLEKESVKTKDIIKIALQELN